MKTIIMCVFALWPWLAPQNTPVNQHQLVVSQQVLSQQLAAAEDHRALRDFARSRRVGYQPVIITLPEGTNFGVTAVVSGDRRYVRITASPLFSGISQVRTFNMMTRMDQ